MSETYTLYTSTNQGSGYTANGTASGASGTPVALTANNLAMYTTYYYYVTVSDGQVNTTSTIANVRTYCSGTTYTCTPSYCTDGGNKNVTCTACNGTGEKKCTNTELKREQRAYYLPGEKIRCDICRSSLATAGSVWVCEECGAEEIEYYYCEQCGYEDYNYGVEQRFTHNNAICTTCSGKGTITTTVTCSHGYTYAHYYCPHSNNRGSSAPHYYCAHSTAGVQHD